MMRLFRKGFPVKRVVVTGRGVISSFGSGLSALMEGLERGESTIQAMPEWVRYKGLNGRVGAYAPAVDEKEIPRKNRRSMSRLSLFGAQAAREAVQEAGLTEELITSQRTGCIVGSTMGGVEAMNEAFEIMIPHQDLSLLSAMSFFKCVSHTASMNIAQYLGVQGYVMATSAACTSALQAIGLGYELIRSGRQDILLCGGAEELHPIVAGTFDILFATSTHYNDRPSQTPRPFDADRDGLVCGEGAGILVLEDYEHARARGAKIFGEVCGYWTCGSGTHVSQSNSEWMEVCIRNALRDAGVAPEAVDYVSAHATATQQGDQAEAEALQAVFGAKVPVSSLKGYIGHTLGASGAIELAASLEMMRRGEIYPTRNLEKIDPACAGIQHVQKKMRKQMNIILKNCFAFGGLNTALICKKFKA